MRRRLFLAVSTAFLALTVACGQGAEPADTTPAADTAESQGEPAAPPPVASATPDKSLLQSPRAPEMNETAPATFRAKFTTTKGDVVIEVHRDWAPNGADRFYNLVKAGYFDGIRFFRVVPGFMAQFGIHGDPQVSKWWKTNTMQDDPVVKSNQRGFITYAKTSAPHSRSTQLFINYGDNGFLDAQGFSPFGEVVQGMEVVDSLEAKYGESPTSKQGLVYRDGNAYLDENFPGLDSIITARLVD